MAKVIDLESLRAVGEVESMDVAWAGEQLHMLLSDPWFNEWLNGDIETISPEELGDGFTLEKIRVWAKKDSANNVPDINRNIYTRNYQHHTGHEVVVDDDVGWDMVSGLTFARSVAAEIFARAKGDAIDENVIQFLIPGLGLSGARDVLGMLRNRDLVLREDHPNVDIWRIRK